MLRLTLTPPFSTARNINSGSAYELYQRTHKSSTTYDEQEGDEDEDDSSANVAGLKVKGRMSRNAARVGCIAGKSTLRLCISNLSKLRLYLISPR